MSNKIAGIDLLTLVFDEAIPSLKLLAKELFQQTYHDWCWILCSNGPSEKLAKFVETLQDPRVHLLIYPFEVTDSSEKLMENIWRRRDYCLKKSTADLIVMLDADIKILRDDYLMQLAQPQSKADLLVYPIIHTNNILPKLPIQYGCIDMGNYCFHRKLTAQGYPCTIDWEAIRKGKNFEYKDYHFFKQMLAENNHRFYFIHSEPMLEWNGNASYVNLCKTISTDEELFSGGMQSSWRKPLRELKNLLLRQLCKP